MIRVIAILVTLLIATSCFATDWYVDNGAGGTNAGTSWANAWESFADVVWDGAGVVAGDTLYISGGAASKTYLEKLEIGASGGAGNRITVQVGPDANHNGQVIITSGVTAGIHIVGQSYITISGYLSATTDRKIQVTGSTPHGVLIGAADHITLEYLEVDNNGDSADEHGFSFAFTDMPTDIEVRYCDIHDNYQDAMHFTVTNNANTTYDKILIHHNDIYNVHDDAIESWVGGMSIYNNTIGTRILPHRGHPDMLQLYSTDLKIYNNHFKNWYIDDATCGSGTLVGIYLETDGGDQDIITWNPENILVYNNLFEETIDTSYLAGSCYILPLDFAFSDGEFATLNNIQALNNTFVGMYQDAINLVISGGGIGNGDLTDVRILNNIIDGTSFNTDYGYNISDGDGNDITVGDIDDADDIAIDYNDYYNLTKIVNPGEQDYSTWKTNTNADSHGITSDPSLDGNYEPDSSGDSVVDVGADLSATFTTDKNGTGRPVGSAFDIGAYEFTTSVPGGTGVFMVPKTDSSGHLTFSPKTSGGHLSITVQ